jgi:tripartite-type tricarboxylate transporter receptor subunit TctC
MTPATRMRTFTTAAALIFVYACPGHAQTYPTKPVRFVVSTSAGSGADVIGRLIAAGMSAALGQQVVVENRAGASGTIGAEYVARSAPDGYTVLQVSATHAVAAALSNKLPYDLLRDFAPVTQFANAPNVVVAHPSLPAKSIRELVKLAKAKPGAVSFGSAGTGAPSYSAAALFAAMADIDLLHVPYRGGGEALTAVLTGETQLMFGPIASTLPHIRRGSLRLLALTSNRRIPLLPDTPTIAEAGYPEYDAGNWYGLVVPLKTPHSIVVTLRNAALAALANPDTGRRLTELGYVAVGDQPQEFAAHMSNDIENLTRSFRAMGVRTE